MDQMDLQARIQTLMSQSQLLQYKTLCGFLKRTNDTITISNLRNCAWCVRGAWVVHSELVRDALF